MTSTNPTTERDDQELVYDDTPAPPGRPVRLVPTPTGFWRVTGGIVVAMLAPLFGILIGSTMGGEDPTQRMEPLFWGFFIGGGVGALGLVAAGFGVRELLRSRRGSSVEDEPETDE